MLSLQLSFKYFNNLGVRVAGFIGKNSVNEAGQHLLKAMEVINDNRPKTKYVSGDFF